MKKPEIGDKVYFAARKGPRRVVGMTELRGEKALELIRGADYPEFNCTAEALLASSRSFRLRTSCETRGATDGKNDGCNLTS